MDYIENMLLYMIIAFFRSIYKQNNCNMGFFKKNMYVSIEPASHCLGTICPCNTYVHIFLFCHLVLLNFFKIFPNEISI